MNSKVLNISANTIAIFLLGLMFILMFFSAWNDSATMDELAHIPAGYSYLTQKDMRLNPEHPPLIKDLAAFPLIFLDLNFPTNVSAWQEDVNGQWTMGSIFLYESGNNPDKILRFARLPIMLLALLFGWLLFVWARRLYGNKVGLLTLFFFCLSPTFIAHSRYVTTDLAAAFGFFIGLVSFIKFLEHQDRKHLIIAGIAFGIAQLLKFSVFLLVPIYILLAIIWVFVINYTRGFKYLLKEWIKILAKLLLIGLIGIAIIWLIYLYHTWNYPPERQAADTEFILQSFGIRPLAELTVWMADKPILRPIAQYLLGLLMVIQRAAGGNTTYFLGQVSASGWWYYFPVVYLLKETLAFHILTIIALIFAIHCVVKTQDKGFKPCIEWIQDNFALFTAILFIVIYWGYSMQSNLNIGVRHILPTFPFIYLLVSREIVRWLYGYNFLAPRNILEWLQFLYKRYIKSAPKYIAVAGLLFWMSIAAISAFPYYLSYFNLLVGGAKNGYKYVVDSNYDWGQDLKRLADFVNKNNIEKIRVDYFGGGSPSYYLKDKYEPWWSSRGRPQGWFAVSINQLQGAQAKPVKGFVIKPEDSYSWLQNEKPVARAGTSIFIYRLKP